MHRLLCAAGSLIGQGCDERNLKAANDKADDRAMPNDPNENANENAFAQFTSTFGYNYPTDEEYRFRQAVWNKNHNEVEEINKGNNKYKLKDNKFSTWTDEEYNNLLSLEFGEETVRGKGEKVSKRGGGGGKKTCGTRRTPPCPAPEPPAPTPVLDDEVTKDWTQEGAVLPVKDQGGCGSCWAFAATAPMEAAHFFNTGDLIHLSEQQMVDCDTSCYGCNGGWHSNAMEYAQRNPLALASDYPYTGVDGTCQDS